MRLTENVVCRGCGAPAKESVCETGEISYEATKSIRKAEVRPDGSIAVDVSMSEDTHGWGDFDSHGWRCDKCDQWGKVVTDVVEREVVPEEGDRFYIVGELRNGTVEEVVVRRQRATEVVIDGATYDFRNPEELELIEPNPHQIPLPIGGNA